jgi:chemotaxis regulatin CheY-phosphate phosphatase CheZ
VRGGHADERAQLTSDPMPGPLATREPDEGDYASIEAAVMETDRGRWFLAEFARRNRHAETEGLLESLGRIERAVTQTTRETGGVDRFKLDVLEMSRAIAKTRAEIAAIRPSEGDGRIVEASGELGSIVSATERATSEILAAAERVQEVAWALREAGAATEECDELDHQAVAIYTSCSFQDLTAQRTRKVIDILAFLESRVNAMADIWQFAAEEEPEDTPVETASAPAAPDVEPMSQDEIDVVLVEQEFRKADIEIELVHSGMPQEPVGPRAALYEGDLIAVPSAAPEAPFQAAPAPAPVDETARMPAPECVPEPAATDIAFAEIEPESVIDAAAIEAAPPTALDDAFLFEQPLSPPPGDSRGQLQLLSGGAAAAAGLAKARGGEALTADEAAAALDALKNMSVEERTKLFS